MQQGRPLASRPKDWDKVRTGAGVPGLLCHDLRRSGVRNLRRLGVQESVAMRISGHKTRAIFERTTSLTESTLPTLPADSTRSKTLQQWSLAKASGTIWHDCGQLHQNCGRRADEANCCFA
jgi:integrase